jgi:hypothetical protein
MEFAVYDGPNRRASLLVGVALIVGMLAAFGTFFVIRHGETTVPPPGSYLILFPLTMILALFLYPQQIIWNKGGRSSPGLGIGTNMSRVGS